MRELIISLLLSILIVAPIIYCSFKVDFDGLSQGNEQINGDK